MFYLLAFDAKYVLYFGDFITFLISSMNSVANRDADESVNQHTITDVLYIFHMFLFLLNHLWKYFQFNRKSVHFHQEIGLGIIVVLSLDC